MAEIASLLCFFAVNQVWDDRSQGERNLFSEEEIKGISSLLLQL